MGIDCLKCPAKLNKEASHCCGIIPFNIKFLESRKDKFQSKGELKDAGDVGIILTPDLLCVFLNRETKLCSIYDERPQVCRDYGMIEKLPCLYFKRSGNPRSVASQKQVSKKIDRDIKRAMENK
jgi:Fe-S-cluster containining protein